jgi:hypothetical protein
MMRNQAALASLAGACATSKFAMISRARTIAE